MTIIAATPQRGRHAGLRGGHGTRAPARPAALAGPDDVAMILHTSGTTSRPKRVPLRHRNLVASVAQHRRHLRPDASDVALCVMPLFHIHGIVASMLSTLASGGTVICPAAASTRWGSGSCVDDAQADLVLGGADDAPDCCWRAPTATRTIITAKPLALHPLQQRGAAAGGAGADGGDLRRAGAGSLRHDRGDAPDGLQPAAAARRTSPARSAAARRGCGDHGRRRQPAAAGRAAARWSIQGPNVIDGYENNPEANADRVRRTAGSAPATRACSTRTATWR